MLFIMGTTNRMPPSEGGTIMQTLRQDAQAIIDKALADALPDSAVRRALEQFQKPEA